VVPALAHPDLPDDEIVALRADVERALAEQPAACVPALAEAMANAAECGLAFDAVAIRWLRSKATTPLVAAGQLGRPTKCQWKLVSALREVERVEPTVAAAVLRLTSDTKDEVRGTAWLALGTLERIARGAAQADVVACIDPLIAAELATAEGDPLANLVSAAGNAGCDACRPTLRNVLAQSKDDRLRRSAVAAFRFSSHVEDVDLLCGVLRKDRDPGARGAAAFALRFGTIAADARAGCLFDGATQEEIESVRRDAVASLAELAENDQLYVGVLAQVVSHAKHEGTRRQAAEALRAFASDEAIMDALEGKLDP
jgi:hypothetical protein